MWLLCSVQRGFFYQNTFPDRLPPYSAQITGKASNVGLEYDKKKHSFVDAFFNEEAVESKASKKSTRIELIKS